MRPGISSRVLYAARRSISSTSFRAGPLNRDSLDLRDLCAEMEYADAGMRRDHKHNTTTFLEATAAPDRRGEGIIGTPAIYVSLGGLGFDGSASLATVGVSGCFDPTGTTRSHGARRKFCFAPMYRSVVEILECPNVMDNCSICAWFS